MNVLVWNSWVARPVGGMERIALEIALRVVNRRLSLLHAGVCLLDLRLQGSRVYFRQRFAQLNLLTNLQIDRLELPGNLE